MWRLVHALLLAASLAHHYLQRPQTTIMNCAFWLAAGVAVRSGHHCTQPLHQQLSIGASSRASLYIYNTAAEVDKFIESLESTIKIFD